MLGYLQKGKIRNSGFGGLGSGEAGNSGPREGGFPVIGLRFRLRNLRRRARVPTKGEIGISGSGSREPGSRNSGPREGGFRSRLSEGGPRVLDSVSGRLIIGEVNSARADDLGFPSRESESGILSPRGRVGIGLFQRRSRVRCRVEISAPYEGQERRRLRSRRRGNSGFGSRARGRKFGTRP